MQPHSMAMLALVNYVWDPLKSRSASKAKVRVEYRDGYGRHHLNVYELSQIQESKDRRELKAYIIRGGGGLACKVNARRTTTQEGGEVTQTHDTVHISGLREIYTIRRDGVRSGRHENSMKYGRFEGDNTHPERKKMRFYCEVKNRDDRLVPVPYHLELDVH